MIEGNSSSHHQLEDHEVEQKWLKLRKQSKYLFRLFNILVTKWTLELL
jgi:hypothetical protein